MIYDVLLDRIAVGEAIEQPDPVKGVTILLDGNPQTHVVEATMVPGVVRRQKIPLQIDPDTGEAAIETLTGRVTIITHLEKE